MQPNQDRAQIDLLLLAAIWLDIRGWVVDTADLGATAASFEQAAGSEEPARIEEALGRAIAHFHSRGVYRRGAMQLARRFKDAGLLREFPRL